MGDRQSPSICESSLGVVLVLAGDCAVEEVVDVGEEGGGGGTTAGRLAFTPVQGEEGSGKEAF